MPIFFRIAEDGKKVYVVKTLFSKDITASEFENKARRISVDDFLSKFPIDVADRLEKIIEIVREIDKMDLSKVEINQFPNVEERCFGRNYYIGDKFFSEPILNYDGMPDKEAAVEYAKEFYGEEFAKKEIIPHIVNDYRDVNKYYDGKTEISREQYYKCVEQKEKYTSIQTLEKILNKSPNKR